MPFRLNRQSSTGTPSTTPRKGGGAVVLEGAEKGLVSHSGATKESAGVSLRGAASNAMGLERTPQNVRTSRSSSGFERLYAPVVINDKTHWWLVDTGAEYSVIRHGIIDPKECRMRTNGSEAGHEHPGGEEHRESGCETAGDIRTGDGNVRGEGRNTQRTVVSTSGTSDPPKSCGIAPCHAEGNLQVNTIPRGNQPRGKSREGVR